MGTTSKKTWKVKASPNCTICGKKIETKRFRKYCSTECRNRRNYLKFHGGTPELRAKHNKWQQERRQKMLAKEGKPMIQCQICGKWFRQVGSHVYYAHKMTAREYREYIGVDRKKGLLPDDLRQLYGEQALENGTYKNLKAGREYWFRTGDPEAGRYERSDETMERLRKHIKTLHAKNKKVCQHTEQHTTNS